MADSNIESVSIYTADVSQLAQSFSELMKQIDETRTSMKGLKSGTAEYNALAQKLTQQEKALAKAFKDGTMQIDKEAVSYRQLNNVLKDLRKTYREVGSEEERTELTSSIQAFDKELKSMDADIGNFQRNVGNYSGALKNVSEVLLSGAAQVGILDNKTSSLFIKLFKDIPKLISGLGTLENTTIATGNASEVAGTKGVKALSGIISKLGVLALAVGAAVAVYKMFQGEIDRGIRKAQDWGKAMLGIEEYTLSSTKAQQEFAEALKESTAQLGGQIATYKILETLVNSHMLNTKDNEKATRELLKAIKDVDAFEYVAAKTTGNYSNAVTALTEALYEEAKASAVVKFATGQIEEIIDLQNQIIEKQVEKNQRIRDKEEGKITGFWNKLRAAFIAGEDDINGGVVGWEKGVEMVGDQLVSSIDKDIDEIQGRIDEIKAKLPNEIKDLLETLFPEGSEGNLFMRALFGDAGSGGSNDPEWYSKMELAIKEAEALQEDYWKFSKKGYGMYMAMYDEIAAHYADDEKKYRETLANKKAFHKQYLDYMKKLNENDQDYGQSSYQKELNELERWHKEQIKIYDSAGKDKTNLEAEYTNRMLKIQHNYQDKYKQVNETQKNYLKTLENSYKELTSVMIENFKNLNEEWTVSMDFWENGVKDTVTYVRKDYEKFFITLKNDSMNFFESQKDLISAETDVRIAEINKQKDEELFNLKERLGNTKEYEAQKAEVIANYNARIAAAEKRRDVEIESELRNSLKRQLSYIEDYYESRRREAAHDTDLDTIEGQRYDWNSTFGRFGQTTAQDSIAAELEKLQSSYDNTVLELTKKQKAVEDMLTGSTKLSIQERLSLEEEYVNLSNQLTDARLDYEVEKERQTLELDKQIAADKVQMWTEIVNQIGNLLGAVYSAMEANTQANLKEGKITQEEAEKQLEKYRYVKATGAAMDALGSAVGAYNSMASIPYVGPALGIAAAAAALAAGYANVRQILAVSKNNVGSGSSAYKEVTPVMPDFNPQLTANATGQQETEALANAVTDKPVKAFVVESEVSAAQELANQRSNESTF